MTRCAGYAMGAASLMMAALACSDDDSPSAPISSGGTGGSAPGAGGEDGGQPGGTSGSSGTGGSSDTGGASGDGGAGETGMLDAGRAEFAAVLEGESVRLTTSSSVWLERCSFRLRLVQREGNAWTRLRDDRIDAEYLNVPHYLDGELHDACRLGCDVLSCQGYAPGEQLIYDYPLFAREYVGIGEASAPRCGPDAGVVRQVLDIESRAPAGPIGVEVTYHLDRQCRTDAITTIVPVD